MELYDSIGEDVLHIAGESHEYVRSGGLLFSTERAQRQFSKIILNDLKTDPRATEFAEVLDARMKIQCAGRRTYHSSELIPRHDANVM